MGYSLTKKGYILLNLDTKTMFVNRIVKLVKDVYPFKLPVKNNGNIFIDDYVGNVSDDMEMFQMMNPFDCDVVIDHDGYDACSGDDEIVSPAMRNSDPSVIELLKLLFGIRIMLLKVIIRSCILLI